MTLTSPSFNPVNTPSSSIEAISLLSTDQITSSLVEPNTSATNLIVLPTIHVFGPAISTPIIVSIIDELLDDWIDELEVYPYHNMWMLYNHYMNHH